MSKDQKCFVCHTDQNVTKNPKKYTNGRHVCRKHFMIKCPECGDETFFLHTKKNPEGIYACFNTRCGWTSKDHPEYHSTTMYI